MRIGVPAEVKADEHRVGLTAVSVRELTQRGHDVVVESGTGTHIRLSDDVYEQVGATVVATAAEVYEVSDLIVKVKEPQSEERRLLREGQVLFAYLHLAPDAKQTEDLLASGATCIAYETVTGDSVHLPLLAPMSQVAGRLAVQAASRLLESPLGGPGILFGGVPGVPGARVTVLGGGVVGSNAIQMALGLHASVTVLDRDPVVLDRLESRFGPSLQTIHATSATIADAVTNSDVVIGAVLVPGARAPRLVTRDLVGAMESGAVLVDVAIDQGGCFETSRPTTHSEPTYVVDGVTHYCVANMPGAVPWTSSRALNIVTLPHVLALAGKGLRQAMRDDVHLQRGLSVHAGQLTDPEVAHAQRRECVSRVHAIQRMHGGA